MSNTNGIPTIRLNNGADMPALGFGTAGGLYRNDAVAAKAVREAIEVGYRMFDTAEDYNNEDGVGQGIRDSGIDRSSVFITTKFNVQWHGRDLVRQTFEASAKRLGTDYVDLLMIHWPNPRKNKFVDAWLGMIDLLREGRVRAIGMSNFKPAHLERILETGTVPDVNQVQLNPSVTRAEERAFHKKHGIVTQAWAPTGKEALRTNPAITEIAKKHGKGPLQIILRWHIQLGVVPLPCSRVRSHMEENFDVFDFELSQAEIDRITALDGTSEEVADSDAFGH